MLRVGYKVQVSPLFLFIGSLGIWLSPGFNWTNWSVLTLGAGEHHGMDSHGTPQPWVFLSVACVLLLICVPRFYLGFQTCCSFPKVNPGAVPSSQLPVYVGC